MSGVFLAIDTATSRAVVAAGTFEREVGQTSWLTGHRHGETLLPEIERFLAEHALDRTDLTGLVVGTGPGAFTGLRVGIATAKGLAHGLGIPLVGVSTGAALLAAASTTGGGEVLLLPAGPSDRVIVRLDQDARLLPGGTDPEVGSGETLIAVDLDGRAPDDALERGAAARLALGRTLLRLGAARLAQDPNGELATLVPEYVTLPRGAAQTSGSVEWSRDPR